MYNYIYEHPYRTTAATMGSIGAGAFLMAGGAPLIIANPSLSVHIFGMAGYWLAKESVDSSIDELKDFFNKHPYITSMGSAIAVAGSMYFGGAAILAKNLVVTAVLGVIHMAISGVSVCFLGADKSLQIHKQCFNENLATEILPTLVLENNFDLLPVQFLGFSSSCVLRKTARTYFLNEKREDYIEMITVSVGSGAIGGALKYGAKAFIQPDGTLKGGLTKMGVGAINHAIYTLSAAFTTKNSPVNQGYSLSEIDDASPFIAESVDSLFLGRWKDGLVPTIAMYGGTKLLPVIEAITSANYQAIAVLYTVIESITSETYQAIAGVERDAMVPDEGACVFVS